MQLAGEDSNSGPVFIKRTDVLPQDLMNYVKFQSDWKNSTPNLAASRLHEIWR